jgi:hypothetical protein
VLGLCWHILGVLRDGSQGGGRGFEPCRAAAQERDGERGQLGIAHPCGTLSRACDRGIPARDEFGRAIAVINHGHDVGEPVGAIHDAHAEFVAQSRRPALP